MTTKRNVKLHYGGSIGWLIFWFIVLFPVGIVLMLTHSEFELDGTKYAIRYDGSRGWLAFWMVIFFPVAILLAALKGFSVEIDRPQLT